MFKMSTIGTNTSMQALWTMVNCVINQRLLETSPHMQQTLSAHCSVTNMKCHYIYITNKILLAEGIHYRFQIWKKY